MIQIEGKARRTQKYDRMFFWYVPLMAVIMAAIFLNASGWHWPFLAFPLPGLLIGMVLGVLLRDVP